MISFAKRTLVATALVAVVLTSAPVHALDVTFDNGTGGTLTIVDNGAGDLNPAVGVIDFSTPAVGGTFTAAGRVYEDLASPVKSIRLTGIGTTPGTFRNVGAVPGTFTVTFSSTAFPPDGPWVRYRLDYYGSAEDPTPDDVEIPAHEVTGWLNGFTVLLSTLPGPPIPLTAPGGQPVPFGPISDNGYVAATATTIDGEFWFTGGPGDQINLPNSFDIVLNEEPVPVEESTWGKIKALY